MDHIKISCAMKNKILELKWYLQSNLENAHLDENAKDWVNGILGVINSRAYLQSNVDDLFWFFDNGMGKCQNVLDFGCGSGYLTLMLSRFINKVHGHEYQGKWVGQSYGNSSYHNGFLFIQSFIKKMLGSPSFGFYKSLPLKFENESFDGIVLYAVIEHLDKSIENEVLKEIHRVLKPGGFVFIAKLPRKNSYQERICPLLKINSHERLYTEKDVSEILNRNGFEITKIDKTGMFINHPNGIVNVIFPFFRIAEFCIDKFLPILKIFSHDFRVVAVKK